MSWKKFLGGYDADGVKDAIAISFDEKLDHLERQGQNGVALRANAAALTMFERFGRPSDPLAESFGVVEVLPFAFLSNIECLAALTEYVVFKESPENADRSTLRALLQRGVAALMAHPTDEFDAKRLGLWKAINGDQLIFAWATLLDEASIGLIVDGVRESAQRLRPQLEEQWRSQGIDPSEWGG